MGSGNSEFQSPGVHQWKRKHRNVSIKTGQC